MKSNSYPKGAVIHFTAGRASTESDAKNTFAYLKSKGIKAVVIGPTGQSYFPDQWESQPGPHAGASYHPALGNDVSRFLIGFEIACEGKLTFKDGKFFSWFETVVPKERVITYPKNVDNIEAGHYALFTTPQVERLKQLLFFLKEKYKTFDFDFVLGHDEVAIPKGRKNDPGGALAMTMPEFRDLLKKEYAASKNIVTISKG